jgi:hypothetical protein
MIMAMVMDTMTILIAATMETMVTGIMVIVVQGVDPVIGDEIKEQGDNLSLIKAVPLQCGHFHPNHSYRIVPPVSTLHDDYNPVSNRRGMRQEEVTSFDPCGNK